MICILGLHVVHGPLSKPIEKLLKVDKGLTSRGQRSWHSHLLKNGICHIAVQVCHFILSCLLITIMPDMHHSAAGMKHDNELKVQGREQIVASCSPVTNFGETMSIKDTFCGQLYAVS